MLHRSLCLSSRLCCLPHIHLERTELSNKIKKLQTVLGWDWHKNYKSNRFYSRQVANCLNKVKLKSIFLICLFWKSESVQYLSFISRLFVWGLTISRAWDREDVWLAWKFSQTFCQTWKFSQTFCQTWFNIFFFS